MRYIKLILFLIGFCSYTNVCAQLSTNEKPVSFGRESELRVSRRSEKPTVIMPELDIDKITEEDYKAEESNEPPRFGFRHRVNYDLANAGTWYEFSNGDKLWRLDITCPNALSVSFCYNKFWIPQGGKLFVYSKDKAQFLGAFTSRNNKGDREHLRGFATGLIYGSDVVLEYYQPKDVTSDAIISVEYIVHGYRFIWDNGTKLSNDCSCMVDINCSEGDNWQIEKKAVAKILVGNEWYGTGFLVNSTDIAHRPLFLTANHCISQYGDAVGDSILDTFIFCWNYEVQTCKSMNIAPNYSTTGATILANNIATDFALLELAEDPFDIDGYTPYYLGWDNSGQSGLPGVCIHHPQGEVKKISTVLNTPISSFYSEEPQFPDSHWEVEWKSTQNGYGVTIQGSSGSPLLNASHKVIGQLHASDSDCGLWKYKPSLYGKFNVSWTGNNNDSIQRRLSCWLDPLNYGFQTWEGLYVLPEDSTMTANGQIDNNICISSTGQLVIKGDVELTGNNRIIVDAGGKLIVDGGTLSNADIIVKPGATIRITHEGMVMTRRGFKAPLGAIVDIKSGKIL